MYAAQSFRWIQTSECRFRHRSSWVKIILGCVNMTDQQIRISSLSNMDLLWEALRVVELNAYSFCLRSVVLPCDQTLENDLKRELTRRFLGTREVR